MLCCNVSIIIALISKGGSEAQGRSITVLVTSSSDLVTGQGLGLEQVCLRRACGVWVLNFVQEGLHNTSPGDFEGMLIKVADSKIRDGLRVEGATGERLGGGAALAP